MRLKVGDNFLDSDNSIIAQTFAVNEIGLDKLFNVFDCANLTSKQKSNAKRYVRETGMFYQPGNNRSMVDEILSYFILAA